MAPLPPSYLDAVVAIGSTEKNCIASGFFYSYLLPGQEKVEEGGRLVQIYLVTNRHVFENLERVFVRVNPQDGKPAKAFELDLRNKVLAYQHPDPGVDVAVVPTSGDWLKELGVRFHYFRDDVDVAFKATLSALEVSEGQAIYTLGFPLGLVSERDYVIVRQGVLARIRDALSGFSDEYLIDSFVFPGNSGGPVVVKPERESYSGKPVTFPYLIGTVRSYLAYREEAVSRQTGITRVVFEENSGLTSVIPIDDVQDCILHNQKEAQKEGLTTQYQLKATANGQTNTKP